MGELYQDLVSFIQKSELKDEVTLRFIDVMEDSLDGYDLVKGVLEKGHGLPVTAINGRPRFYGGFSIRKIYESIK
jgi:hypothetical protein